MLSVAYAFVPLAHLLANAKDSLSYREGGHHCRTSHATAQGLLERLLRKAQLAGMLPRYRAVISENDVIALAS